MITIYNYLTDIKDKYFSAGKPLSFIAFVHEDNDYDRWALIVSGNGINNSKQSMSEAYKITSSSMNGKLPNLIRSIYTLSPDSALVVELKEYLQSFKAEDPSILKQINRIGINDGYFIVE